MNSRASNASSFIESLWNSLEDARSWGLKTPSEAQINSWLMSHGVPFRIQGNELVRMEADSSIGAPSSAPESSFNLPAYQLHEIIGQGGFGVVHRATRSTSVATFEYALKVLNPSSFADKDKALRRFQREVQALQALQHRAIVPYVDGGIDLQGRPYLVMPNIKGSNIRDASEGNDPAKAILLVAEVLDGLHHAHESNILHRDLKPSNILVRASDGQPVILDFGTAFVMDDFDAQSLTTAVVGSIGYIPPEVLADPKNRTKLHDLYSCAVIAYELIARRRPNPQQYAPLASQDARLAVLDDLLVQALGPPAARPKTAAEFRDAIVAAVK